MLDYKSFLRENLDFNQTIAIVTHDRASSKERVKITKVQQEKG